MPLAILLVVILIVARWFWNTITSTPWIVWTLIGIAGLITALIVWALNERRKWSKSPEGQRALKAQEEQRRKVTLVPEGFPAQPYLGTKDHGLLAVDPKGRQLAIGSPMGWSVFDYEDVFGAELDIGEGEIIKTSSSRSITGALVGGAAFGVAGAIVGGTGGKTTSVSTKVLQRMVLRIHVRDMEKPVREISFNVNQHGPDPKKEQQLGREWFARIQMIVDENDRLPAARGPKAGVA